MSKNKRLAVIAVVGGLCILIAGSLRSCIMSLVHPQPWKIGAVSTPDGQLTASLWGGSMQEALIQPYDGIYRILEVSRPGQPSSYYDMPSTITEDGIRMEVYRYSTNNILRLKDTKFAPFSQEFRSECLLDLNAGLMFAVVRRPPLTYAARLSAPRRTLAFPQSHYEERVAHTYGSDSSGSITIGDVSATPSDAPWTAEPGEFIGVIEPK